VRVNLLVGAEGENADVYIPKRSLPVVPTVPACASPLTATALVPTGATAATPTTASPRSAGSVVASPSSTRATGADVLADPAELADTGGNPLLALGLLLVAGALATGQARRRERAEPGPEVTQ
jgi:hypothetical protein